MIVRRRNIIHKGALYGYISKWISNSLIDGEYIDKFEKAFAGFANISEGVATSCGIHALSIILEFFIKDRKNDEIYVPAYTAKVIKDFLDLNNYRYKLIDIDPERGTMDARDFEQKITSNGRIALITHLFGNVCSHEVINLAKKNGLIVVEDCAHAHGASVGTLGDAAFYSFDHCKLINTFTGGILLSENMELIKFAKMDLAGRSKPGKIKLLIKIFSGLLENLIFGKYLLPFSFWILRHEKYLRKLKSSINFIRRDNLKTFHRFTNFQACIGLKQLEKLDRTNTSRYSKYKRLLNHFNENVKFLKKTNGDVIYYMIVLSKHAPNLKKDLADRGIDSGIGESIMYPLAKKSLKQYPGTLLAINNYVQIPIHSKVKDSDIEIIAQIINSSSGQIPDKKGKVV